LGPGSIARCINFGTARQPIIAHEDFGELAREEITAIDEGLTVCLGLGDRLHGADAPPVQ
jgi:hypothetical protein